MKLRLWLAGASTVLALVAVVWCGVGAGAALHVGIVWPNAVALLVLVVAALVHFRDPHVAAALALAGAAYARLPVREAWQLELWPLEALVAAPLWCEAWASARDERWARVSAAGIAAALVAAAAAVVLPLHAHWIATAPLALLALLVLRARHVVGVVATIALGLGPVAAHLSLELLVPGYPAARLAPLINALLVGGAIAAIAQAAPRRRVQT